MLWLKCYDTHHFFFATRIIFKYSLQAHVLPEPADASYIAKDGLTTRLSEGERVETGFMFQISEDFYLILCSRIIF
jgi:hypothetical protein